MITNREYIKRKITSIKKRDSIILAIKEYDTIGKKSFLNKYGYDKAAAYYIIFNGKEYDSKAIIGVSFKYEYTKNEPLKSSEFSGGVSVQKQLELLGFKVVKKTIVKAVIKALNILETDATIEEIKHIILKHKLYTFGAQESNINDVIRNQISRYCDNLDRKDSNGIKYFTKTSSKTFRLLPQVVKTKILKSKKIKDFNEFESLEEGEAKLRYSYYYERKPKLREYAINIHGTTCKVCGFNFEEVYGKHGKDYIQIHHIKPLSETKKIEINPEKDLIPLCANCHVIVHREKNKTLTIEELKKSIKKINVS